MIKKRNHAARKPPRLRHVLETHAAGLNHRYDRLPCLGLSCCLSAGHLALRISNLLMICVLMPFWTSLLVRIVAWMIMLQQQGVLNDSLVGLGIISDENRLPLMYNFNGTLIVMTQVLLPFMILPLYSVMRGIPQLI